MKKSSLLTALLISLGLAVVPGCKKDKKKAPAEDTTTGTDKPADMAPADPAASAGAAAGGAAGAGAAAGAEAGKEAGEAATGTEAGAEAGKEAGAAAGAEAGKEAAGAGGATEVKKDEAGGKKGEKGGW